MKLYKLAISAVCLSLLTCTQTTSLNKNINSEYSIYLTGRVLDNDGKPVANAVAKLVNRNLSDTTSTDGCYYIMEKRTTGMAKTMSAGDTLKILKAGQVITRLDIEKWIDTLPDVFIVQRDIYGNLSSPPSSLSKITATITGDSIPDSLSEIAELGYISATQKYSGFVYFVYTAQTLHYNVYVSVYSADSVLIGRSVSVGFPSTAGDIDMPTFDPNNVTPSVYAGNDTIVSIHDTIRLHAVAVNLYGLSIIKWEWSINGGSFVQTSTGDTNIIAPPDSNPQYSCAVRATRSDNKIMTSSMKVTVCKDVPIANAGADTSFRKGDTIRLHGSRSSDHLGRIIKYEWDIGNHGVFIECKTGDTNFLATDSFNRKRGIIPRSLLRFHILSLCFDTSQLAAG